MIKKTCASLQILASLKKYTFVTIHKNKATSRLDKHSYIGMWTLELNWVKYPLYEVHYDYIKNKYGTKWRLLFTDSDSLVYKIETKSFYDEFSKNKKMFGFSNYFSVSKYYDD